MTTHKVVQKASSALTHLESGSEWSARRQSRQPPLCSFPARPGFPGTALAGGRTEERRRGLAALCFFSLTTTTPELSIILTHIAISRAHG